jgi:hypothetical protein
MYYTLHGGFAKIVLHQNRQHNIMSTAVNLAISLLRSTLSLITYTLLDYPFIWFTNFTRLITSFGLRILLNLCCGYLGSVTYRHSPRANRMNVTL